MGGSYRGEMSERRSWMKKILQVVRVTGASHEAILKAIDMENFKDFEDCLQDQCAETVNVKCIVIKNVLDFTEFPVKAIIRLNYMRVSEDGQGDGWICLIPPYFLSNFFHVVLHFFFGCKARFLCFFGKSFSRSFEGQHCGVFKIESAVFLKNYKLVSGLQLQRIANGYGNGNLLIFGNSFYFHMPSSFQNGCLFIVFLTFLLYIVNQVISIFFSGYFKLAISVIFVNRFM